MYLCIKLKEGIATELQHCLCASGLLNFKNKQLHIGGEPVLHDNYNLLLLPNVEASVLESLEDGKYIVARMYFQDVGCERLIGALIKTICKYYSGNEKVYFNLDTVENSNILSFSVDIRKRPMAMSLMLALAKIGKRELINAYLDAYVSRVRTDEWSSSFEQFIRTHEYGLLCRDEEQCKILHFITKYCNLHDNKSKAFVSGVGREILIKRNIVSADIAIPADTELDVYVSPHDPTAYPPDFPFNSGLYCDTTKLFIGYDESYRRYEGKSEVNLNDIFFVNDGKIVRHQHSVTELSAMISEISLNYSEKSCNK